MQLAAVGERPPLDEKDFVFVNPQEAEARMRWLHVGEFRFLVADMLRYRPRDGDGYGLVSYVADEVRPLSNKALCRRMMRYLTPLLQLIQFNSNWEWYRVGLVKRQPFPSWNELLERIFDFRRSNEERENTFNRLADDLDKVKQENWRIAKKLSEHKKISRRSDRKVYDENNIDPEITAAFESKIREFQEQFGRGEKKQSILEMRLHIFREEIISRKLELASCLKLLGTTVTTTTLACTVLPKVVPSVWEMSTETDDVWAMLLGGGLLGGMAAFLSFKKFYNWLCSPNGDIKTAGAPISVQLPETLEEIVDSRIPINCHFDAKSSGPIRTIEGKFVDTPSRTCGILFIRLGLDIVNFRFDFSDPNKSSLSYGDLHELRETMLDMLEGKTLTAKQCLTVLYHLRYGEVIRYPDHPKEPPQIGFINEESLKFVFDRVFRRAIYMLSFQMEIKLTGDANKPFLTEKEELEKLDAEDITPGGED